MPLTSSRKVQLTGENLPTAAGAYIFAGGFTLGVRRHFKVLCHLEETDYGVRTCRHNMPGLPIHVGPDEWPIADLRAAGVDFLYGNPPCAAWSVAGYTKTRGTNKWETDPRVACTERYFQLLREVRPKFWAWESVTQAFTKGRVFVDDLTRQAVGLGYSVSYLLHDAQWFGLPQVRKRFFMVCHRVDFKPLVPDFTTMVLPIDSLKMATKVGDPCPGKDGKTMDCGLGRRFTENVLATVRPGQRLVAWWKENVAGPDPDKWERTKHGNVKGRPSFGHCRLPLDRPGGAVVGYALVHPVEHRFLSTEEMQVLSGFPPDYHFTDSVASKRAGEIARGVCPPVGEWLARSVAASLRDGRPVTEPTVTVYDFRKPPGSVTQLEVPVASGVTTGDAVTKRKKLPTPIRNVADERVVPGSVPTGERKKPPTPIVRGPRAGGPVPIRKVSDQPESACTSPRKAVRARRQAPPRRQGIGKFIRDLLRQGKFSPEEIVERVRARFPESRATVADVDWNRRRLEREGQGA